MRRSHRQLRAFELVAGRAEQRVRRHVGDGIHGEPLAILGRVLEEAVPLDDERRTEAAIWYAFIGLVAGCPPLQEAARDRYRGWQRFVAELLQAAQHAGTAAIDDIDRVATEAIAVADGIALRTHLDPNTYLLKLKEPCCSHGSTASPLEAARAQGKGRPTCTCTTARSWSSEQESPAARPR